MHEMSLMKDLIEKIDRVSAENGGSRVVSVDVWLGALSHISAAHFKEHYVEASKGTSGEDASLIIEESEDIHDPRAQDILLRNIEVEVLEE